MTLSLLPALVIALGTPADHAVRDLRAQLLQANLAQHSEKMLYTLALADQSDSVGKVTTVDGVNSLLIPRGSPRQPLSQDDKQLLPAFDADYYVLVGNKRAPTYPLDRQLVRRAFLEYTRSLPNDLYESLYANVRSIGQRLHENDRSIYVYVIASLEDAFARAVLFDVMHLIQDAVQNAGFVPIGLLYLGLPTVNSRSDTRAASFALLRELSRLSSRDGVEHPIYPRAAQSLIGSIHDLRALISIVHIYPALPELPVLWSDALFPQLRYTETGFSEDYRRSHANNWIAHEQNFREVHHVGQYAFIANAILTRDVIQPQHSIRQHWAALLAQKAIAQACDVGQHWSSDLKKLPRSVVEAWQNFHKAIAFLLLDGFQRSDLPFMSDGEIAGLIFTRPTPRLTQARTQFDHLLTWVLRAAAELDNLTTLDTSVTKELTRRYGYDGGSEPLYQAAVYTLMETVFEPIAHDLQVYVAQMLNLEGAPQPAYPALLEESLQTIIGRLRGLSTKIEEDDKRAQAYLKQFEEQVADARRRIIKTRRRFGAPTAETDRFLSVAEDYAAHARSQMLLRALLRLVDQVIQALTAVVTTVQTQRLYLYGAPDSIYEQSRHLAQQPIEAVAHRRWLWDADWENDLFNHKVLPLLPQVQKLLRWRTVKDRVEVYLHYKNEAAFTPDSDHNFARWLAVVAEFVDTIELDMWQDYLARPENYDRRLRDLKAHFAVLDLTAFPQWRVHSDSILFNPVLQDSDFRRALVTAVETTTRTAPHVIDDPHESNRFARLTVLIGNHQYLQEYISAQRAYENITEIRKRARLHVFTAEQIALEFEARIQPPRLLSPAVVTLLEHRSRLTLFTRAHVLKRIALNRAEVGYGRPTWNNYGLWFQDTWWWLTETEEQGADPKPPTLLNAALRFCLRSDQNWLVGNPILQRRALLPLDQLEDLLTQPQFTFDEDAVAKRDKRTEVHWRIARMVRDDRFNAAVSEAELIDRFNDYADQLAHDEVSSTGQRVEETDFNLVLRLIARDLADSTQKHLYDTYI